MKDTPRPNLLLRFGWALPLIAGVVLGIEAAQAMQQARASWSAQASPRTKRPTPPRAGRSLAPVTLSGPGGSFRIPPPEPTIVHVWLQGCADCMPKFEALAKLRDEGHQMPLPVVNVAYQRADPGWAKRYAVDERLVVDPDGKAVVFPLGIGTLTTLVVDTQGQVVLTDYPNKAGYVQRVQQAARTVMGSLPPLEAPENQPPPLPPPPSNLRIAATLLGALALGVLGSIWGLLVLVVPPGRRDPDKATLTPTGDEVQDGVHLPAWQEELIASGASCPYCQERFGELDRIDRCERCAATFHRDCGEEVGGCTTLGCSA